MDDDNDNSQVATQDPSADPSSTSDPSSQIQSNDPSQGGSCDPSDPNASASSPDASSTGGLIYDPSDPATPTDPDWTGPSSTNTADEYNVHPSLPVSGNPPVYDPYAPGGSMYGTDPTGPLYTPPSYVPHISEDTVDTTVEEGYKHGVEHAAEHAISHELKTEMPVPITLGVTVGEIALGPGDTRMHGFVQYWHAECDFPGCGWSSSNSDSEAEAQAAADEHNESMAIQYGGGPYHTAHVVKNPVPQPQ